MAKKKETSEDKVRVALDLLSTASDAFADIREQALEDLRFVEGEQWEDSDKRDREDKGRPCIVINKLQAVVKQIINDGRQNTPSIKVRPVDRSSDPDIAEVQTGLIKNIENESDADSAYDFAFESAVKCGIGYIRVLTDYASDDVFDQDIMIDRIENPFAVYIDPAARRPDRSDMRYAFVVDKMPLEDFKEMFPKSTPSSINITGYGDNEEDYVYIAEYWKKDKKPRTLWSLQDGRVVWKDEVPKELHEEVAQFVTREKQVDSERVTVCKISATEVLEEEQEWAGKYIPIVPVFGEEVWIEGKLFLRSAIYHAKDSQRLYNWSRSMAAETLAMTPRQPFMLTPEQIEGYETDWNEANETPMPYLLYNDTNLGAPQRAGMSIPDQGAMTEMMASADDIKSTTGIYDASLGAKSNETSGRAIMARQREGDTATFAFHDNLTRAIKHVGRILVDLIPKIYDTERQVRILGKDNAEKIIMVNQPLPDGTTLHDLTVGRYDVVVDTGPSYTTMRMETADSMIQFMQAFPPAAQVIGPRLAKVLDFPDSDEIADELQKLINPQADPAQMKQAQMQMQMQQQAIQAQQQAEQMKAQAEAQKQQGEQAKTQMALQKGQQELELGQVKLQQALADLEGQKLDNVQTQLEIKESVTQQQQDIQLIKNAIGKLLGA